MFSGFKIPEKIILASKNPNKIEELHAILKPMGVKLRSSLDYPELHDVDETSDSLEGNAYLKALYTYNMTGVPSLADDTGLEVEALDGRPGVFSARYAGEKATYQENMFKLLQEMEPHINRKAQFRTVLAYISEEGTFIFQGVSEGIILRDARGKKGFGYDPIFLPDGKQKTFAEMNSEEKNEISHRGKAVNQFVRFLKGAVKP
jgi:XTP/dITP diphosphohydrolase